MNKRKEDNDGSPRRIPTVFNAQKIGESLREVDVSLIQTENEKVMSRWFHGPNDADVFIWTDEKNNVIKQQVTFCGQVVEWNVLDGLRTGVIVEQEIDGPSMAASEIIRFDKHPQTPAVYLALDLLKHVRSLDERTKSELVHQLTHRPSFLTMSSEDIIRRYGTVRGSTSNTVWRKFLRILNKAFR